MKRRTLLQALLCAPSLALPEILPLTPKGGCYFEANFGEKPWVFGPPWRNEVITRTSGNYRYFVDGVEVQPDKDTGGVPCTMNSIIGVEIEL